MFNYNIYKFSCIPLCVILQDAHRREALLLPSVSSPQRSHEQPQCSHSEESWHVLAGDDRHSNNNDDDNDNDDSDNDVHYNENNDMAGGRETDRSVGQDWGAAAAGRRPREDGHHHRGRAPCRGADRGAGRAPGHHRHHCPHPAPPAHLHPVDRCHYCSHCQQSLSMPVLPSS